MDQTHIWQVRQLDNMSLGVCDMLEICLPPECKAKVSWQ
jgi:hypothetical protein